MESTNGKSADANMREFAAFVSNVLLTRSALIRQMGDPRRSVEDECGYPKGVIETREFQELYDRDAIAVRVVQVLPRECWQIQPLVYEKEAATPVTAFEEAFKDVGRQLLGEDSFYEDDEQSPIWEYGRRVDEQSGIGTFGVMLLGVDDNRSLNEPADFNPQASKATRRLQFIRVFPESLVTVDRYETNPRSRRWGMPISYSITFADPSYTGGIGLATSMSNVHWTRIVHVADNLDSSELFGAPRMRPVYNRLKDLEKLYAGSAEMYWRGAFPGLSLETNPQVNPTDVNMDQEALREMMENYGNSLQRYIALMGMTAKSLAPQVVDPTPQIRVQIEAICIRLGVPKRIFMGSERGELASAQDDKTWNDRLKERQRNYITPRIIVPLIDRLINLGVLPKPKRYRIEWPDMTAQTEADRVRVAIVKTEAFVRYAASLPNPMLAPEEFLTLVMGYTDKEAQAILEGVREKGWESVVDLMLAKKENEAVKNISKGVFVKPQAGEVVTDDDGGFKMPGGKKNTLG